MATSAFGKAFREARNAGEKEFTFNGKRYTTKLADEVEQPSVGGKPKSGEYKTRAPYSDRGRTMTEAAATPRDFSTRVEEIDRETQGDAKAMKYVPRRAPTPDAEETNLGSAGYKKGGYTKAADGIAKRGKTRGTMVMCKGGMYKK
jgi:hypothetical protein